MEGWRAAVSLEGWQAGGLEGLEGWLEGWRAGGLEGCSLEAWRAGGL